MALSRAHKRKLLLGLLLVGFLCGAPAVLAEQPSQPSAHDKNFGAPANVDGETAANHSSSAQGQVQPPSIFNPNADETQALLEANRRAARDNLFVKYLLLSCATIGAIIAFVVWRSMPPTPKANTEGN